MADVLTADQKRTALGQHPLFASLGAATLDELSAVGVGCSLRAGETLMREGDPPGDVYLLMSGRLEAWIMDGSGSRIVVGEIGPGEIVGEMSLVSDAPRSASVRARRDSTLLQIPKDSFTNQVLEDASSLLAMTRLLVQRLDAANRSFDRPPLLRTITLVPAAAAPDVSDLAAALADAFRAHDGRAGVEVVERQRIVNELGATAPDATPGTVESRRVTQFLHDLEVGGALVVLVADEAASLWTERCIRQADRILLAAEGRAPALSETEQRLLFPPENPPGAPIDLVLVHRSHVPPTSTTGWLAGRGVGRHHHVWAGDTPSLRRLVRRLTGTAVGLVLSGGGARGLAHIGIYQALQEAGVVVDAVGGVSFGASVAGGVAYGYSAEEILATEVKVTVESGGVIDLTFPYVALAKGRRLTSGIEAACGTTRIEDLPIPFFCVSSDLTAGKARIHDRGPLAAAVRASASIPGLFPPVRTADGHALVDGAIMDNLPVGEMRRRLDGGHVIAVDLRTPTSVPVAELPHGGEVSGWKPLLRRINPAGERAEIPRIVDILMRATEMASGERHDMAEVTLRPPVERFGLLEFGSYEAIVDAGYRYATQVIEADGIDSLVGPSV